MMTAQHTWSCLVSAVTCLALEGAAYIALARIGAPVAASLVRIKLQCEVSQVSLGVESRKWM